MTPELNCNYGSSKASPGQTAVGTEYTLSQSDGGFSLRSLLETCDTARGSSEIPAAESTNSPQKTCTFAPEYA